MIAPGSRLGVLGGGQLGLFFAVAARQMGYSVVVWDPDPGAPAHRWADRSVCLPFESSAGLRDFLKDTAAVTYEWENLPAPQVLAIEAAVRVRPQGGVLRLLQNRIAQKQFLVQCGLPVVPFRPLSDPDALPAALAEIGFPAVCKTATAGYDGRGQWRIGHAQAVPHLSTQLPDGSTGWVLEKWVPHTHELSVIVARGEDGEIASYPVAENVHENGVLRRSRVPAFLSSADAERAIRLAEDAVTALSGIGVFCVEFFLLSDGALLINEIAPRPHNSGHYTLDAATTSQFEQQVRILCGLPLGAPQLRVPAAVVNILGREIEAVRAGATFQKMLSISGVHVYLYGKLLVKPGRKMGHICVTDSDPSGVDQKAGQVAALLGGQPA